MKIYSYLILRIQRLRAAEIYILSTRGMNLSILKLYLVSWLQHKSAFIHAFMPWSLQLFFRQMLISNI